jgi:hypothetical protein
VASGPKVLADHLKADEVAPANSAALTIPSRAVAGGLEALDAVRVVQAAVTAAGAPAHNAAGQASGVQAPHRARVDAEEPGDFWRGQVVSH